MNIEPDENAMKPDPLTPQQLTALAPARPHPDETHATIRHRGVVARVDFDGDDLCLYAHARADGPAGPVNVTVDATSVDELVATYHRVVDDVLDGNFGPPLPEGAFDTDADEPHAAARPVPMAGA